MAGVNTSDMMIKTDESVLVVIDVQDSFLSKLLSGDDSRSLVARICWMVQVARWLNIPVVATAEDIPNLGGVTKKLEDVLPKSASVTDKMTFNLAGDEECLAEVERTNRKTAILVGLETDVCIAQSAMGLLGHGYNVVGVIDATGSPGAAHDVGIQRMRDVGVTLVSTKSLFYEWMRTVAKANQFQAETSGTVAVPEGVIL